MSGSYKERTERFSPILYGVESMIQNTDIYRCYSNCLKEYLTSHDIKYFLVAKDIKSNKVFYAYEKNANLLNVIQQWENNNPKKQI